MNFLQHEVLKALLLHHGGADAEGNGVLFQPTTSEVVDRCSQGSEHR